MAEREPPQAFDPNAAAAELEAFDPQAAFRELAQAPARPAHQPSWAERWIPGWNPPREGESPEAFRSRTARAPDLGRYIANSATFGAADPAIAALTAGPRALISRLTGGNEGVADAYRNTREDLRAGERATDEAYGYAAPIAGMVGGVGLGPSIGQTLRAAGRLAEGVGAGAIPRTVMAGVTPVADSLRRSAAGRGLLHLLTGVREGGGSAGLTAAINQEGPIGENALTGAGIGAGIGSAVAGAYGAGRLGRNLMMKVHPTENWANQNARQLLSNSIGPEVRLAELEQGVAEAQRTGAPLTIADLGRENVRSRAEAAYKRPGEGRDETAELLNVRMEEQPHRVAALLSQDLAPQIDRGAASIVDAFQMSKQRLAKPHYDEAYAFGRVASSDLDPFIRRLEASDAMNYARKMAEIDGRPFTGFDRVGATRTIPAIDMQDVDYIQRGLRAAEQEARRKVQGSLKGEATGEAGKIGKLRDEFLTVIDDLNPAFKKARALWREDTEPQEAIAFGRRLLSLGNESHFENAIRDFKKMPPEQRDWVRLGYAQDIIDRMNRVAPNADAAKTMITPKMANRARQLFENETAFNDFMRGMKNEALMGRTAQRVIGGSRTAQLQEENTGMSAETMANVANSGMHLANAIGSGHWAPFVRSILPATFRWMRNPTMDKRTATELQRILFNPTPADNMKILQEIRNLRAGQRVGPNVNPASPQLARDPVADISRVMGTQNQLGAPSEPEVIPVN